MELWIVGFWDPESAYQGNQWEFVGVFDSEKKAVAACTTELHFTGPAELNKDLGATSEAWPGGYFPLNETPDEADYQQTVESEVK